ncbi:MAG TPA: transporter substrate-binding domain-containing protein [Candidatus Krumholzibacteria bacterium]|nr:transporter substrate-binding domain-containing protein [Candidatus Krumholzibacteria bacterium]
MKKLASVLLASVIVVAFCGGAHAQKRLDEITKRGSLRVGMTGEQPPFTMEKKDGTLMGYEVDLAKLLAQSMNLKLETVRMPFNELIDAVQKGKVDVVMSGMTITMERNMKVAFIGPYILSGKSIVTKMESLAKVHNPEDLDQSDLRISSLKGSTSEQFVKELLPKATSLPADNYDKAIASLLSGEANVMVADYPICKLTALKNPDANLVVLDEPMTIEPIGMALPADDPLLLNFMENYFSALNMAGLLTKLEKYWFEEGTWLSDMK